MSALRQPPLAGRFGLPRFHRALARRSAPLDPDSAALLARMTVQPSAARAGHIDAAVVALKGAGLWAKIATLHLHAAHDAQAGALNWKGDGFSATPVGGPAFVPTRPDGSGSVVPAGYQGNGATSYLDLGAGLAAVPGIATADHGQLVWTLTDSNANQRDAGTAGSASNFIISRSVTSLNCRSAATTASQAVVADSLGLTGYLRGSPTSVDLHKNGAVVASIASTAASFGTGNVTVLQSNNSYSTRLVAVHVLSRYLTPAEGAQLYAILLAYLRALGAVP